jgi:hypothetical protein
MDLTSEKLSMSTIQSILTIFKRWSVSDIGSDAISEIVFSVEPQPRFTL